MLEYLFDPDYRDAKSQYNNASNKKKKLEKIVNDITNDTSSINAINNRLDYIYDDFTKAIRTGPVRSRVQTKLAALKEPYQTNDSDLANTVSCIGDEINELQRKMNTATSSMNSIKTGSGGR